MAKLVVFDTLPKYLDSPEDLNHQGQLIPQLQILDQAAKKYNCAIVLITHLNKNEWSKSIYRGQGTIGLAGFARSSFVIEKGKKAERVLSIIKSNLAPDDIVDTYQLDRTGVYHFIERSEETTSWDEDGNTPLSVAGQKLKEILSLGARPSNRL